MKLPEHQANICARYRFDQFRMLSSAELPEKNNFVIKPTKPAFLEKIKQICDRAIWSLWAEAQLRKCEARSAHFQSSHASGFIAF